MQVKGEKEVTLKPGDTLYEGPQDVHVVGRNASTTQPAKFVVFFVKEKGAPILVPEKCRPLEEVMENLRIFLGSSGKQAKLVHALTRGLEDVAHVELCRRTRL
jgi:hypothetical protein